MQLLNLPVTILFVDFAITVAAACLFNNDIKENILNPIKPTENTV